MAKPLPQPYRNRILARLGAAALARIEPLLEPVEMPLGMVMETAGEPVAHAYFPASGVASMIARDPHGRGMEAGLYGRDGMSALPVLLGGESSPIESRMQVAGTGHRLEADALRELMAEPGARRVLLLWVQALVTQMSQTVLTNGRHNIEVRLARWLLMCQDRVEGDILELTHEFLSLMMGVRRAGVTVALHVLEGEGLLKATRGRIRVIDRAGLEAVADGTYGVPEAEYARLLGDGRATG